MSCLITARSVYLLSSPKDPAASSALLPTLTNCAILQQFQPLILLQELPAYKWLITSFAGTIGLTSGHDSTVILLISRDGPSAVGG